MCIQSSVVLCTVGIIFQSSFLPRGVSVKQVQTLKEQLCIIQEKLEKKTVVAKQLGLSRSTLNSIFTEKNRDQRTG
jgi:hypothetical protein